MAQTVTFPVHISEPELIRPEKLTPRESKYLSNIDDQIDFRNHIPFAHFYPPPPASALHGGRDPAAVLKCALARVLVYYYPVAGRLRNAENGKLVVDCCGEGVVFREATAGVSLAELQKINGGLKPPFTLWEKLLVDDVWGCNFITDSPLLRMQVTRLACGGFILAYTFNHCICDAYGAYLFISAMAELCTNPTQTSPSSLPSWGREILKPRSPPTISFPHPEYPNSPKPTIIYSESDFKTLAQTSVFLTQNDISALKHKMGNPKCSTFDAIAACLWKSRTKTLTNHPNAITKLLFPIDTRFRYKPMLPKGYYGTAVLCPVAVTQVAMLVEKPLSYSARLVMETKENAIRDEYRASTVDFIEVVDFGRRGFDWEGGFSVSDTSRLRFGEVDFGFGRGVYGGHGRGGCGRVPGTLCSLVGYKNGEGVEGVLALVCLPPEAVARFQEEVRKEIGRVGDVKAISAL